MSDSSEDEDLSKFREAVDYSFIKSIQETNNLKQTGPEKCKNVKSERYLEESGHYNDVKVSHELQKRIGLKLSELISKNTEFVNVASGKKIKKRKIKGGVKLFGTSEGYLTCDVVEDTTTLKHNILAKHIKEKRKHVLEPEDESVDMLKSAVVSGEHILSGVDTRPWRSRRRPKVFKYKTSNNTLLTAVE